jgi:hypothetical protein
MRRVMRVAACLFVMGALWASAAGGALADAPPPVAPHQHYLIVNGEPMPVGPTICSNPATAQGFYGFHQNVHLGTPNNFAFDQGGNPVDFTFTGCP